MLSDAFYRAVERRIEKLTVAVGVATALYATERWGWRMGIGVAAGAAVSWLNFRWLDQGVTALLDAATRSGDSVPSSHWIYARFIGRTGLLLLALYVIFKLPFLPGKAVLAGLFSLICAVVLEVSYEVATGFREPDSQR
jgi:hypothetical protein